METKSLILVVLLLAALFETTHRWVNAERRAAHAQGILDTYQSMAASPDDGTCYAKKGGCK